MEYENRRETYITDLRDHLTKIETIASIAKAAMAPSGLTPPEWRHIEFARVISCTHCSKKTDANLLRDDGENVPQPGYIGSNYKKTRVLLVGQNPGSKNRALIDDDREYTAALRALRDEQTEERYRQLKSVLKRFIPKWPVHKDYFPLEECGLSLEDIAYCNIVRCRTINDNQPSDVLAEQCLNEHFGRWLCKLDPKVVVFIGKWACERGHNTVAAKNIPCGFMNRWRSLPAAERLMNRKEIVALVRKHRGL